MDIYGIEVRDIDGKTVRMDRYRREVLLVVNVASKCGYTPQYSGLEALHRKYHAQGFEVLGFPCDQFGRQEPGSEGQIREFCSVNYGVSFPMFAKLEVNGSGAHPLYQFLKAEKPGVLKTEAIKWNFTKFLVARDGAVMHRYAPADEPESLSGAIEKALAAPRAVAASG